MVAKVVMFVYLLIILRNKLYLIVTTVIFVHKKQIREAVYFGLMMPTQLINFMGVMCHRHYTSLYIEGKPY